MHGVKNGKPNLLNPRNLSMDGEKLSDIMMVKIVILVAKPCSQLSFSNGKRKFTKHAKPIKKVWHAEKLINSESMS